jgi:hypothetical protein
MDLVFRAAAVFILIFIVTRVIGKRELGSLEPFRPDPADRDRRPRPAGRHPETTTRSPEPSS